MDCSVPGFPVFHYLLEFVRVHAHWVGDALQPSQPLPCSFLVPSIFPSIRVFYIESALHIKWPKYWSFSFSISLSNEYSGLISFRIDLFDLLAVQGILKSPLQHHSRKASILLCSAFFMVQLSHLSPTTCKTIALTRQSFVGKVVSLLFNILSGPVMAFLPMSKCLLISWLQSPSPVILEPKKAKSASFHICHEVMGPDTRILIFWMLSFKPVFSFSSFTFIKRLFSSSSLSAMRVVSSAYLRLYKLQYKLRASQNLDMLWPGGGCTDSHSPLPAVPSHFGPRRPHRSALQLVVLSTWAIPSPRSGDSRRQQQQAPLRRNRPGPGSPPLPHTPMFGFQSQASLLSHLLRLLSTFRTKWSDIQGLLGLVLFDIKKF